VSRWGGTYRKSGIHLIGDVLGHRLGLPIVSEYEVQEVTAFYIFQH